MDKKFCKSDKVFVNLMQQVLNQSRFILVDAYDQHCTTPASIDTRLRALVQEQNMSQKKQSCKVTVVSTHCIKNKCPNAGEVQCKILDNLIRARDGVFNNVWCDFCKLTKLFSDIISKIFEPHPKKHFVLLHPETKADCTTESEIMTALHAYRTLQPTTIPTKFKVSARSTHIAEGGCKCTEFVKEYLLGNIIVNFDEPNTRVWSETCALSSRSADKKAIYPKGQNVCHSIESTRQDMLTQIVQISELSIVVDNIQQSRVYDILIRKESDTLGAAVQLASGRLQRNGLPANLGKTTAQIINILESNSLFIGQEISRDGQTMTRVIVLPPSALQRVREMHQKCFTWSGKIVKMFEEFVFECGQPEQMQKMAQLVDSHIADKASLRMDMKTANAHIDSFHTFLGHVGIEAMLKHHYSTGVRIIDDCQGDFLAFNEVSEVKTLHWKCNAYSTCIKPMGDVDYLLCLVLANDVREKARFFFDALQDRRRLHQPCDDLILELDNFVDGAVIDGVFKFVDPTTSIQACPEDQKNIHFQMTQIDGKVVKSKYIYDMTKASYIDTRGVIGRDILALIFN